MGHFNIAQERPVSAFCTVKHSLTDAQAHSLFIHPKRLLNLIGRFIIPNRFVNNSVYTHQTPPQCLPIKIKISLKIRHGGSIAEAIAAKITCLRRHCCCFRNEQAKRLLAAQTVQLNKRQHAVYAQGLQTRQLCFIFQLRMALNQPPCRPFCTTFHLHTCVTRQAMLGKEFTAAQAA